MKVSLYSREAKKKWNEAMQSSVSRELRNEANVIVIRQWTGDCTDVSDVLRWTFADANYGDRKSWQTDRQTDAYIQILQTISKEASIGQ